MNKIPDYINLAYQEKWQEENIFDTGDKWIGTSYITNEKYIAKILEDNKKEIIVIGYFMRVIEKCLSDTKKENVITDSFSTNNNNYNICKVIDYKLISEIF